MTYKTDAPVTDDTTVDEAGKAPQVLMDASLGRMEDSTRTPGLILTKEQIKSIKIYEMAGLALPTTLSAVISYLGYEEGEGAGKGLEPKDFRDSFELINKHARTWNPLRTDLIAVTSKLQIFAGDIKNNALTMDDIYSDVKALNKLDPYDIRTLEDIRNLKDELSDRLNEFNLDPKDKDTVSLFSIFLNNILDAVRQQQIDADNIKKRLDIFSRELAEKVLPEIKNKVGAINNSNLANLIKILSEDIEDRAIRIQELNDAYKKSVREALEAASKLNIVGVAVAIYNGFEAEKIRKERNELRKVQADKIAEMQTKDRVLASLHRVRGELLDLDVIVVDADIATQNLANVWNKITIYIDRSTQGVDAINDALRLYEFMHHFRSVVRPWETVAVDAERLYEVFAQADKEFQEEYAPKGARQGRSLMFMNNSLAFDEPDTQAMRNAKVACNAKMVDATVYHTETDYLPNLFGKFTNLNTALNRAHFVLLESAQKISYNLEFPVDDIARYQDELLDADDDDHREFILKRISEVIEAGIVATDDEAKKMAGHLKSINETFNRQTTLTSLAGLESQATQLPIDIAALEERKTELNGELLTLNDAIKALESKGLAEIGEETILNAEALAALQLAGPHAAIVKAALDLLQKSLADLDAALNYYGLLSLRKNMYTRIDAETQKINVKNGELRLVDQRTRFIESIHGFDDQRVIYAQEYSKIVTSLKSFVNKYTLATMGDDDYVQQWIEDAKAVMGYLPALR
ncbi:alpha-xenorhabdolysin family binary toxin subunit A [Pseudomonas quasicaspiana]|uniref:alpha-xenorhabdolysin family binary toxin subunit A n=1 Tax=Pseudomonas quasicaspiana TaxID=2829821 RepID=UPI001E3F2F10|nr:alpha-xenorhabdolysin family binary toxin subunit A [Pseudomonas quasicaspiana]MCD5974918.1 alpha-xenorhabdolysin family binary toxin subunit A [Pseudomonas quasicaspiana]